MTNLPLVSIIIPCYNYGHFLSEAIESALAQTYHNLECIVIDDGSKDNTEQVAQKYAQQDARLKYVKQDNQGPTVARNKGIGIATGKYILPLDADDKIAKEYTEKAVKALEANSNLGIVYCEARYFGAINHKMVLPPCTFPEILMENAVFATAFFRKEDWKRCGGYNPNMKLGWEDYDFWLSILELERTAYKIPETLFYYRQGHHSRQTEANKNHDILYSQLISNHPKLYCDHYYLLLERFRKAQKEKVKLTSALAKIEGAFLYQYCFKIFIKFENELRRFFLRIFNKL